jgi:hypothetical protein
MFVGDEIQMPVSAEVAAARLVNLIGGSTLIRASHAAWGEGIARVGPAGPVPGLSKLVYVHFLEPVRHGAVTMIGLRWEAIRPGERLFPVLDANITLIPHGDHATLLGLEGVYGPPGGAAGVGLDRAILHHVAAATIRSFLHRTAAAITEPAPDADAAWHRAAWPSQRVPETS